MEPKLDLLDQSVFFGEVRRRAEADGVDWAALPSHFNVASLPAYLAVYGEAVRQAHQVMRSSPPKPKPPLWRRLFGR